MTEDEKRRVAVHEAGHALCALTLPRVDPVHRVTIIPRSVGALGATLQLPTQERWIMTRDELLDRICVLLGGRAGEEVAGLDVSTGAQDDLERATELARQMVCRFGMSDALGALAYDRPGGARGGLLNLDLVEARAASEETLTAIDHAVRGIVTGAHQRARDVLLRRKSALEAIAAELVARETLERPELEALARRGEPPRAAAAVAPPS